MRPEHAAEGETEVRTFVERARAALRDSGGRPVTLVDGKVVTESGAVVSPAQARSTVTARRALARLLAR